MNQVEGLVSQIAMLLYGMTPSEAIDQNICIKCHEPPQFKTKAGEAEYQLSGMCERCFDEEFGEL